MSDGSDRLVGVDVARGLLLCAMLAVHVVSAHGAAEHVNALHGWVGVFLISSGFVGLSGYVIGARARRCTPAELGRGIDRGVQLVLVMFAYGVLVSLLRHGLMLAGTEASVCAARHGWTPPLRFDDLGILLPIAIVQVLGPLAGARAKLAILGLAAAAVGVMLVPALTAGLDGGVVLGVLARRTLTPFYTVTTFVAIGLVGVALGRARPRWLTADVTPAVAVLAFAAAAGLAIPPVSRSILDPTYRALGLAGGDLAALAYWSVVLIAFLRAFTSLAGAPAGAPGHGLALLGRNSLLVFVLHDFLLVADAAARDRLGAGKGALVCAVLIAVNLALLLGAARGTERWRGARAAADALLLGRSRPGSLLGGGAFSVLGGIVLAGVLAVYTSAALARSGEALAIDDFESERCPRWWTFGFLPDQRVPAGGGGQGDHVLLVRGAAPGTYAHGRGLYLDRDLGSRRTLALLVRGDGPGSGRIKIELSEDDNGNWEIEKQPLLYVPLHDDRFVHELSVDWRGWREVTIPLSAFRDDNPGGNGVLDPARDLTSGGLLELQLLFAPSGAYHDEVRLALDHLRFTR